MSRKIRTAETVSAHKSKMLFKADRRAASGSRDMSFVVPKPWSRVTPRAVRYL